MKSSSGVAQEYLNRWAQQLHAFMYFCSVVYFMYFFLFNFPKSIVSFFLFFFFFLLGWYFGTT